jgi:hypothetical protein
MDSHGGMILTGENKKFGEKLIHFVHHKFHVD